MKLPNGATLVDANANRNRAEWLVLRRNHLGGSDIASIMGVGWNSPLEVYYEKRGLMEPTEGDRRMDSASFLEPAVAAWFEKETGFKTTEVGALIGPGHMMSTPDRLIHKTGNGPSAILEIKCPGAHKAADWAGYDGETICPDYAAIQSAWYMLHWDLPEAAVMPLVGGVFGDAIWLTRDAVLEAKMMEAAEDFWKNYVQKGIEPPASGTEACKRAIAHVYTDHSEVIRTATDGEAELIREFRRVDEAAKAVVADLDTIKNQIRQVIGADLGIVSPDGKITYRKSRDGITTEWEMVARTLAARYDIGVSLDELVFSHTTPKPGSRRLLPKWQK